MEYIDKAWFQLFIVKKKLQINKKKKYVNHIIFRYFDNIIITKALSLIQIYSLS